MDFAEDAGLTPALIAAQRDYLLRYALLHLRNPTQAEDAVQETLLAAMEGAARFAGKSTVRTCCCTTAAAISGARSNSCAP